MADAVMNDLARRIFAIIARHSKLPEPILRAQCRAIGTSPEAVGDADLEPLSEHIGRALAMFTTPQKGAAAKQAILDLKGA